MEKVILTKEQERALRNAWQEKGKCNLINNHSTTCYDNEWTPLNYLSTNDIARAVYIGYEVEPEYQKGDWIVSLDGSNLNGYWQSHIEEVDRVEGDWVRYNRGCNSVHENAVRHATKEEIAEEKERRFWKGLGREVNEYKERDIVKDKSGSYGFWFRSIHSVNGDVVRVTGGIDIPIDDLVLVSPFNSRLDVKTNE